jgi:hypothetical protein
MVGKIQKAAARRLHQMAQQVIDDTGRQIIDLYRRFHGPASNPMKF